MKRKDFLRLSAFTAAAISLPLLHSCNSPAWENAIAQPVFLSRLFDKETIIKAGKAYLEKIPAEKDDDILIKLLSDNGQMADSSDVNEIHQFLEEKIKNDFDEGSTILVNGWVLAITEARQCALFSLISS